MNKQKNNREEWVDYAKGIAILLVIYAHAVNTYNITFLGTTGISAQSWSIRIAYIASLHSFYFLAGLFAVKLRERSFSDVLVSKFRLIFIPYMIWAVILGIIKIIFSNNVIHEVRWIDLIFIFVKPIGVTWFLYVLFWGYIIYRIFSVRLNKFGVLLISVILFFLQLFTDVYVLVNFFHFFAFFALGTSLSEWVLNDSSKKYFNVWIALPIFLLLSYLINLVNPHPTKVAVVALSSIYLIISISLILEKSRLFKIINYLGYISLIIYLVHMLPLTVFRVILLKYVHITNIYAYTVVQMILTTVFCLLLNKLSGKIGMRKYLFGR